MNEKQQKVLDRVNSLILERIKNGENFLVKKYTKVDLLDGYVNEPRNYVSNKPYTEVNRALLEPGYYVSFKQAKELGGKVKKGAKASMVYGLFTHEYVKYKYKSENGETIEKTTTKDGFEKLKLKNPEIEYEIVEEWITTRHAYFYVFNIRDCENLKKLNHTVIKTIPDPKIPTQELDPLAEFIVKLNTEIKPNPIHLQPNSVIECSSYSSETDTVYMKNFFEYEDSSDYYDNLFHELSHATGHASRLNRKSLTTEARYGDDIYSKEELVAQISSNYCMQRLHLLTYKQLEKSNEYVKSWYNHLSEPLKKDPAFLIKIFSSAEKASNYLFSNGGNE